MSQRCTVTHMKSNMTPRMSVWCSDNTGWSGMDEQIHVHARLRIWTLVSIIIGFKNVSSRQTAWTVSHSAVMPTHSASLSRCVTYTRLHTHTAYTHTQVSRVIEVAVADSQRSAGRSGFSGRIRGEQVGLQDQGGDRESFMWQQTAEPEGICPVSQH